MAQSTSTQTPAPAGAQILPFPSQRREHLCGCPHCGTHTGIWRLGRLLWAYCDAHELRWVAADFGANAPAAIDRTQLRRKLEFLAAFAEVSRG